MVRSRITPRRKSPHPSAVDASERAILKTFGENLRRIRDQLGLSQEEVAERVGISNKYLSELENGKRSVRLIWAFRLARALGKNLDDLIEASAAEAERRYRVQPRLDDLIRNLEVKEQGRAYHILKAAFKG